MPNFSWLTAEFVSEQRRDLPIALSLTYCEGKTFIVTGANIGVGRGVAEHLVRLGAARVILAVRNLEAGENAKREMLEAAAAAAAEAKGGDDTTPTTVLVWELDLGRWDSVRAFAQRVNAELDRLDGVVQNAAIALDTWSMAGDHETSIQVNVLSTMLLAALLLPKLSDTGRRFGGETYLVMVGSGAGFLVESEFRKIQDDVLKGLDTPGKTEMNSRYALSKLIHMLAVFHFASLFPPSRTGVIINLLNPGLVKSGLTRRAKLVARMVNGALWFLVGRTPEMASRTVLYALVAGEESHGSYVSDCKIKNHEVPEWISGPEGKKIQKAVWDDVAKELERVVPGCLERIP